MHEEVAELRATVFTMIHHVPMASGFAVRLLEVSGEAADLCEYRWRQAVNAADGPSVLL